jgi:benzylsuccinate CoA-transferase BbsF subunit
MVAEAVSRFHRTDLLHELDAVGVPSAPVNSSRDIVENAVLWERGFWQRVEHPVIGEMPISRTPFRAVGFDQARLVRPPLLGEHTRQVLADELGLDEHTLDRLEREEVLY